MFKTEPGIMGGSVFTHGARQIFPLENKKLWVIKGVKVRKKGLPLSVRKNKKLYHT
jgi:hypothetical protein